MISEQKIQEIRERIDLLALVQKHGVELKKAGRSHRGLCPFHSEKSPSFHVWADERRFKCFGCQAGGDAITFVQRILGKSFVETLHELARDAGVDLEAAADPLAIERAQIKQATDFAAQHFQNQLRDPQIGAQARAYLHERGVSEEMMRVFGLGWAPAEWSDLSKVLQTNGLLRQAEVAGLIAKRRNGDGYVDVFRGRVIIPIRSPEGRTIAFGARLLVGDDGPKYLNSKETRLYSKSDTLYGVDQAREAIRKRKSVVICEGYFDCIGLQQAGVRHAVALCSTALTPGHLALLAKLEAKELVLLLDGDAAGKKAVERLAGALLASGMSARVCTLPDGDDPDTWARKVGPENVQKHIQNAPRLTEYLFQIYLPEAAQSTFEAKMAAIESLRPLAAQLPVGVTRSALLGAFSSHAALPYQELEATLRGRSPALDRPAPKAAPVVPESQVDPLEAAYAALILRHAPLLSRDRLRVSDEFNHLGLRSLVAELQVGRAPEEAMFGASETVKSAVYRASEQLPRPTQPPIFSWANPPCAKR